MFDMLHWLIVSPCPSSKVTAQKEYLPTIVLTHGIWVMSVVSPLRLLDVLGWPFTVGTLVKYTFVRSS